MTLSPYATPVNAFDARIGQRIRSLRKQHALSQQTLAAYLGVSFQQLQKYERGISKISFEKLYSLCLRFHVPLTHWLGEKEVAHLLECDAEDRQLSALLANWRAIRTPRLRALVCEMAEALGKREG